MKAAVLYEVNKPLVIEDISVPNPGPREVLIRTRTVTHSPGFQENSRTVVEVFAVPDQT